MFPPQSGSSFSSSGIISFNSYEQAPATSTPGPPHRNSTSCGRRWAEVKSSPALTRLRALELPRGVWGARSPTQWGWQKDKVGHGRVPSTHTLRGKLWSAGSRLQGGSGGTLSEAHQKKYLGASN